MNPNRGMITIENAIVNSLIHDIHSARWVMESEISSVYVQWVPSKADQPRSARFAIVQMAFEDGAVGTMDWSGDSGYGYEVMLEISGETGTVGTTSHASPILRQGSTISQAVTPNWPERFSEAYIDEAQIWINSILKERADRSLGLGWLYVSSRRRCLRQINGDRSAGATNGDGASCTLLREGMTMGIDHDIESIIAEIDDRGFCIIPSVITPQKADAARIVLERLLDEEATDATRAAKTQRVGGIAYKHPIFVELMAHPLIVALWKAYLKDEDIICCTWSANTAYPGFDKYGWHPDYPYWWINQPWPLDQVCGQTIWLLDDFSEENGGTGILPYTHRKGHPPAARNDKSSAAGCGNSDRPAWQRHGIPRRHLAQCPTESNE